MIQVGGVGIVSAGDTFFSSSLASVALFVVRMDPSEFAIAHGSGPRGWGHAIPHVHTSGLSYQDQLAKEVSICLQNHILAFHTGRRCAYREEGSRNQAADATRWEWENSEKLEPIYKTQVTKNYAYLSVAIGQTVFCEVKVVISTVDENVLGSPVQGGDESEYPLRPYNHEEFDTQLMLQAANAVSHGYKGILIMAKDTDIIVLGISFFSDIGADKL